MSETREVKREVVIETTPELAFEAFTMASELREWFSDEAWCQVRPGGRYDVRWHQGYRSDGEFTEVEPPRRAAATWQGTGDPGKTKVSFAVEPAEAGVRVVVKHTGFGSGSKWDSALESAEKGWSAGLENLKSTLETGVDLRLARRPFLGVAFDVLTPERAEREGITVAGGILVLNAVDGGGAQAAGIRPGDVITSLGEFETLGYQELGDALAASEAGDVVNVELVRGQAKEIIEVTLGTRSLQDLPASPEELADDLATAHEAANAELVAALEGVTNQEASQSPAEGEWSIKQVLAHLSTGERAFHFALVNWAVNGWLDGGGIDSSAFPGQLEAAIAATPSVQGLRDRYLADVAETVALIRHLPEVTVAHKARYRRIAEAVRYGSAHTRDHAGQIKETIAAVRGG